MNNGLGFQLANVPTITGLASVNANEVTTDTIEVSTLTIDGVDIETSLNDKVSKTLNNTVTGINTFSNPANVFYGDGANLTGISSSTVLLSNTASGATNYLVMSTTASGVSSLLTDNSGATYNSTTNTAVMNISGSASTAGQVTLSNTASGATNYLVMSSTNSGTSSLLTDNSGATYDSTNNTAAINISGNANTVQVSNTAAGSTNYLLMTTTASGALNILTDTSGATYSSISNTAAINISGTAAIPTNMVTTNTIQTITAKKTFNTDLLVATDMNLGHGNNSISSNVCFGAGTLTNITSAGENIAFGVNALNTHNGPNGNNVAIGSFTLSLGTNPYNSIAIGRSALYRADAGSNDNIALGADVLNNLTTGNGNIAAGGLAMAGCVSGSQNIAIGFVSLISCNGQYNTGIGSVAGAGNKKNNNTYIGMFSGADGEQAEGIVAIGGYCLNKNNTSKLAGEGHNATGIGYFAGGVNQQVGVNNTFLGAYTDIDTLGNWNNSTAIGYGAIITASNQIRLGRATETVSCPGNLNVTGTITNSDLTFLSGTQTITGAKTMNNVSNIFYGDGSNLSGIATATNATNAVNVGITNVPTDTNIHYLTFSQFTSGNRPLRVSNAKLTYQPDTNSLQCINNSTGVGDIRTGYLTLANSTDEFIIDLISSNVRMYQGTVSKDIHFDFYDGTLDKTTFTSTLNSTNITPNGAAGLEVSTTAITCSKNVSMTGTLTVSTGTGATATPTVTIQDNSSSQGFKVMSNITAGGYNSLSQVNDASIVGYNATSTKSLTITSHSATTTGVRITPTTTLIGAGGAAATPSSYASFSGTGVTVAGLTTFTQDNIILNATNNFNVGYGAGGISNLVIGRTAARTVAFGTGNNTIIGDAAGAALNSTARDTTLIGVNAGDGITTGNFNTHIGSNAGNQASGTGDNNTSCGYIALGSLITTGANNSAFGYSAGYQISTGQNNTCLGYGAGVNITTGGSNIMIGSGASGTATAQNKIVIGTTAETMYIQGGFNWRVGAQITNSTNGNLATAVLCQFYTVAMTAGSQTITLPNPAGAAYLGARVTFKRKTNTTAFTLTSTGGAGFVPIGAVGLSASPHNVGAGIFQVDLVSDGVNWCIIGQQ
jgi:hypothetical protein